MAETNPEYIHGRIYRLFEINTNFFYIGSTSKSLRQRLQGHKGNSKIHPERRMFEIFTHEKFCQNVIEIELLEEVIVHSIKELREVEKRYVQSEINNLNCLNESMPLQTKEERKEYKQKYNNDHKEESREYKKKWYIDHKEENKERITCDCGRQVRKHGIPRHKKSQFHKDFIANNN